MPGYELKHFGFWKPKKSAGAQLLDETSRTSFAKKLTDKQLIALLKENPELKKDNIQNIAQRASRKKAALDLEESDKIVKNHKFATYQGVKVPSKKEWSKTKKELTSRVAEDKKKRDEMEREIDDKRYGKGKNEIIAAREREEAAKKKPIKSPSLGNKILSYFMKKKK